MYDNVIRNAMICDGLGNPLYRSCLGIAGDRIVAIENNLGDGKETIDADGLVLAPGIIDIHTHYDAQITWDPFATPSTSLGVTTIVMGNCGFGVAPCRPKDRDLVVRTLTHVEGMPLEAFQVGINWDFESFPDYLTMLEDRGLVPNVAAFIPHSPLRCFVMGERAFECTATDSELEQMKKLVSEALKSGAIGFSSSTTEFHNGEGGRPVPSRLADTKEFQAILKSMSDVGLGVCMITRGSEMTVSELEDLYKISHRPVIDSGLLIDEGNPSRVKDAFTDIESAQRRGNKLFGQVGCLPITMEFSLKNPYPFEAFSNWLPAMEVDSPESYKQILLDPTFRSNIRKESAQVGAPGRFSGQWEEVEVVKTGTATNHRFEGRTIADIATELNNDPLDVFFDLGISENLETQFSMRMINSNEDRVKDVLAHPYSVIGQSDAGAHLTFMCDAAFGPHLLGRWVRERGDFELEHAIQLITSRPAKIYGIKNRGLLKVGAYADLLLFDPDVIAQGQKRRINDLPADCSRIDTPALGIHGTWINGKRIVDHEGTRIDNGLRPGQVLREFNG